MIKTTFRKIAPLVIVLALVVANAAYLPKVFAATFLTHSSVILYNMNASGTSQVAIAFTTASAGATSVTINFTGWSGGANGIVNTTQSVATTGCTAITGASNPLPGGSLTAAGATSTITISSVTALAASTSYCAILTSASAVTNPSATGPYSVTMTAGSDSSTNTIDVISNDQVVVNATVPPSFTMALGGTIPDNFTTNLSTGATATTTGVTVTFNTNAKTGWFLWGTDANGGVKSASQNYTIASKTPGTNGSLTNNTEGYLTGIPAAGITQGSGAGVTSAVAAYASSGAGNGSGLDTTQRQLASSTGTASGAIVTLKEYATIAATTPAASDYSDTITLVGAGSF